MQMFRRFHFTKTNPATGLLSGSLRRFICLCIAVLFMTALFPGCKNSTVDLSSKSARYRILHNIPGITEEEILAVEKLRDEYDSFIYAMPHNIELFHGEDGNLKGFSVLTCEWLTELFGIPFMPAIYEWSDLVEGLKTGEIDFTGTMTPTDERRKIYLMTDPIAERSMKYFRMKGNPSLTELSSSRPLRFALLERSTVIDHVNAELKPGTFETFLVKSYFDAYELLVNGIVDAFIHENTAEAFFIGYGNVITEDFYPLIFSPVSLTTQNPALTPIISAANKAIHNGGRRYLADLYNHGYNDYLKQKLFTQFTEEERAFIRDNPVISYVAQYNNFPISFYNERENKWQGIAFDLLTEIEKLTGLSFQLAHGAESIKLADLLELVESSRAAFITELIRTDEWKERFIWLDATLLTSHYALVSKVEQRALTLNEVYTLTVGTVKDTVTAEAFRRWFPGHEYTVEYNDTQEAFDALGNGEVDLIMTDTGNLLVMTNYLELAGYKANIIFSDFAQESSFGLNKDELILCSIMNKTLGFINIKMISDEWKNLKYDFRSKLAEAQKRRLIGVVALLITVLVFAVVLLRRRRHEGKRLESLVHNRTAELDKQNSLMNVVNDANAMLMSSNAENYANALTRSMETISRIVKSFRVYLWQHHQKNDGRMFYTLFCRWTSEPPTVEENQEEYFYEETIPGWEVLFAKGESMNGPVSNLQETSRLYFKKRNVASILAVPIFLDGTFWGFASFGDQNEQRVFSKVEEHVLRSWGSVVVGVVLRNEVSLEMRDTIKEMKKTITAMDYIDCMICVADMEYNAVYINNRMAETYGVDRNACDGQKCYMLKGFDKPCSHCLLPAIRHKNDPGVFHDYGYVWDEHTKKWLGGKAAILHWTDGSLVQFHYFIDETIKKEYESRLLETVEAVEAASASKSAFLANMSHEIRTPMNSIIGFSELAMDDDISLKTKDYLSRIIENSNWLLQIINDILDISKVEAGKMELESIPFDLHEVFTSCRTIILPKAKEKNLVLHFYAEPSTGKMLLGDPTRLRQVIINLLSNAVKFTSTGAVKLLADIIETENNRITIRFEVKDSGIGMTPEQIEKIYEPFAQADSGTTRKYGGTGLGLAITKRIVDLMGGKLAVDSTPGVGSIFSFNLKFGTIDAPEGVRQAAIASKIDKPIFEGEVLLCEDNHMNQQVICDHLERIGLRTVVAENGKDGVELAQGRMEKGEKPFDLIFMDIHMPVMDGLEATLKLIDLKIKTPIVALTANIMSIEMDVYIRSGMKGCLGKPFTSQELWRCLLKHLKPVSWQTSADKNKTENDEQLLKQLRCNFVNQNQSRYREIADALKAGDITLAHRYAHNLKSNAGLIDKPGLQKIAADLESALKDGQNKATEKQLENLETELSSVLDELSPLLNGTVYRTENNEISYDPAKAQIVYKELEPLLKKGNTKCLSYIEVLSGIPECESLIHQMEAFDFDSAYITLSELLKRNGEDHG
jgi:signal transduction histidine kinase/DNA-binding response OmpR family regulator/ABC-type amino acid transport substrate-binding protein